MADKKLIVVTTSGPLPALNFICGPILAPWNVDITTIGRLIAANCDVFEVNPNDHGVRLKLNYKNYNRDNFDAVVTETVPVEPVQIPAEVPVDVTPEVPVETPETVVPETPVITDEVPVETEETVDPVDTNDAAPAEEVPAETPAAKATTNHNARKQQAKSDFQKK